MAFSSYSSAVPALLPILIGSRGAHPSMVVYMDAFLGTDTQPPEVLHNPLYFDSSFEVPV